MGENVGWGKEEKKCMLEGRRQVVVSKRAMRVDLTVKGI